jgi:hypothetical protein
MVAMLQRRTLRLGRLHTGRGRYGHLMEPRIDRAIDIRILEHILILYGKVCVSQRGGGLVLAISMLTMLCQLSRKVDWVLFVIPENYSEGSMM